ncbi:tetratricopeptide repeat protein [Methylocystis parvus]|uniref:Tetratricopeptide repeat protein n=1 Tax=Methylocystis parvus TaxID=134 RepID=A0A6B8MDG6_9HYPH|nr:tetratricopeptide repeat protein [Methylocystis parvus]QGM98690.1 tetratricopeptide repeat protein [Methylocystis parvus]WBK00961.1 tetratricopeptide repeat protein [Methylocystis parvus OBBP]
MIPRQTIAAAMFVVSCGGSQATCLYKPFEFFPDRNDGVIVGEVIQKGTDCQHKFKEGKGYRFTSVAPDDKPPVHGAIKKIGDREFIYTPQPDYVGDDIYAFKICATKGKKQGCSLVAFDAHIREASDKGEDPAKTDAGDCRVGDADKAIAACGLIIDDAGRDAPARGMAAKYRGMAYFRKGDLAHAEADFSKAAEFDPSDSEAFSNRGLMRQQLGQVDNAIADYDKAIALKPGQGAAYANRALAWRMKGDLDRAVADASKAIELGLTGVYRLRADLYRAKGESARARADEEEAKKSAPGAKP